MKSLLCTHKANEDLSLDWLEKQGELVHARDWRSVLQFLAIEYFDAVFLDVLAVKGDYELFLHRLEKLKVHTPLILFTSDLTLDLEFLFIHPNLFGFFFQPESAEAGKGWVQRIKAFQKLYQDTPKPQKHLVHPKGLGSFIGNSLVMLELYRLVLKAIQTDYTILITGSSGTGKEVAAQNIHRHSNREKYRFVSINCAAIPDNLLESELFGYEPGAFTGAQKSKPGKIELADQGTLFLDEIGDMPTLLQSKLLRVLEEQQVERLGSQSSKQVNVRILAATNQNLSALVESGRFRSDLYYRLNVVPVKMPALSKRRGDIPLLVCHFLKKIISQQATKIRGVEIHALDALQKLSYPGHVRELENLVTRLMFLSDGRRIMASDVDRIHQATALPTKDLQHRNLENMEIKPLWQAEKEAIELALIKLDGNISHAAKTLEISRNALYHKIKAYGIEKIK